VYAGSQSWPDLVGFAKPQLVQYWPPPAESAQIVKARILAINSANSAWLPIGKEPLPFPKPDQKVPAEIPPE
jgi:hypothetical protein